MNHTATAGQRQYVRIPFHAKVQLHLQGRTLDVQLIDIALKGALVQCDTPQPLALQEKCSLVLPLADQVDGVVMAGKIVHQDSLHVGIECEDIDVTSLTRLRRLIELNTGNPALMDRELSRLFAVHGK